MQEKKSVSDGVQQGVCDHQRNVDFYNAELVRYRQRAATSVTAMYHYLTTVSEVVAFDAEAFHAVRLIRSLQVREECKRELISQFANRAKVTKALATYVWHSARMVLLKEKLKKH